MSFNVLGVLDILIKLVGLAHVEGCTLESHIIHSMLSCRPHEICLNKEDFDYAQNMVMAVDLIENISHLQTGFTFADMWLSFRRVANMVHGNPNNPLSNPILLNTDWEQL